MASDRLARVNELLKREIASVLYRVVDDPDFDFAAVTVTEVRVNSDLRKARVFLSIRGENEFQQRQLKEIRRHRKEFQEEVAKNVVLKYNPQLKFDLDASLEQGARVLKLLSELDGELPPDPEDSSDR